MQSRITDFLAREERRRNRSLSKTFLAWLETDRAASFLENLDRLLAKPGQEFQAVTLLKQAEETARSDQVFKKQDRQRKQAIKKFNSAFKDWMTSKDGAVFTRDIQALLERDDLTQAIRADKIQEISDLAEQAFLVAHPHFAPSSAPRPKSKISNRRRAWSQNVDDVVYRVIEPGLHQMGFIGADLLKNWPKIVGPAVARNSRPERVLFAPKTRSHGKIFIHVRAGFNTEIMHQKEEIIRRVNSYFGYGAISEIQISKKPFDHYQTPGQQVSRRVVSTRIVPKDRPSRHLEKIIEDVTDPNLKQALYDWGRVMHGRNGSD